MNRFDPARRTILKATAAAGGAVAVPLAATVEAAAPAASPSAANTAAASTMNVTLRVNGREHKLLDLGSTNGTFLNGITRQRVIGLLRDDGVAVEEATLSTRDVLEADEVFSTGNYAKVVPVTRVEGRDLPAGPLAARARALYWEFAFR